MSNTAFDITGTGSLVSRGSSVAPSPSLIRWTLRTVTFLLFGAATAVGVNLGMGAPEISPASVVQHDT